MTTINLVNSLRILQSNSIHEKRAENSIEKLTLHCLVVVVMYCKTSSKASSIVIFVLPSCIKKLDIRYFTQDGIQTKIYLIPDYDLIAKKNA